MRDRRPALAALAVLLILGGALVSGLIALRSGERVDHLMLTKPIGAGQQITAGDVTTVALAGGEGAGLLSVGQVGGYATSSLPQGTLLTRAMVSPARDLPVDSAVVGLNLAAGQAPAAGLVQGDVVQVLQVPTRGGDDAPVVLVKAATVVSGAASASDSGSTVVDTSSGLSISVIVPRDAAADVAAAASSGAVAVVKLPAGTRTTVDS